MQVQEILHEVTQNIIRSHGLTKTGASASKHGLKLSGTSNRETNDET